MLNRRAMIFGSALVLGASAALGALLVVNNAQSRANSKVAGVAVYIVAKNIPSGTSGDAALASGLVKADSIPRKFFPSTAVTDITVIRGKVAGAALVPGQILVSNQFVPPQAATTSSNGVTVPPGQVAITITLDPMHAAAGLIVPGDKIDLLNVFPVKPVAGAPPTADTSYAHFFYQNAVVLAIGTTTAPAAGTAQTQAATPTAPVAATSTLYTLALPPEAAERIVLAAANGALYAALVPPNNTATDIPAVGSSTVDGPQPTKFAQPPTLTPYGK